MKKTFLLLCLLVLSVTAGAQDRPQQRSYEYEKAGFRVTTPQELGGITTPNFFAQPGWRYIDDIVYRTYSYPMRERRQQADSDASARRSGIFAPYIKYNSEANALTREELAEAWLRGYGDLSQYTRTPVERSGVGGTEFTGTVTPANPWGGGESAPLKVRLQIFQRGAEFWGLMTYNDDPELEPVFDAMFQSVNFR